MTAPNASRLIHLLIEERAKVVALLRWAKSQSQSGAPTEDDTDRARREIERDVLTKPRNTK